MGRLLVCSEKRDYDRISSFINGFTKSATGEGNFGHYSTYQKLRIPTKNCFCDGDNYAIGVGTFVYKGQKDADALKHILQDWNEDMHIRSDIIGSYCVGIYKDGIFSLFVDESGTYKLYYYLEPRTHRFAATTTMYHLAKGLSCRVDDFGFLGDVFMCNIDGHTMCPEIQWLTGDQVLRCQDGVWGKKAVTYSDDIDIKLQGGFCKYLKSKYRDLPNVFQQSATFLTGGQDSRITLSLMLSLGMKPVCCYGIGDSTITNTKNEDLQCVRRLAAQHDLPVYLMDWKDSDFNNKADYLNKYGEQYSIYGMNKNFFLEFEKRMQGEFFTAGYLGEAFRAVETISEYPREKYTLSQYIDEIYLAPYKNVIKDNAFSAYRGYIYQQYYSYCERHNIDIEHLTKDDFQMLNSIYRLNWDMRINQTVNMFFYSFPLFGDRKALEYVNRIPYQHKINSKFQMECIEEFCAPTLEIPFFSHIKPKTYDPNTHELTETQLVVCLKEKVKKHIGNPTIYRIFRYLYYILRGDTKGLREVCLRYNKSSDIDELVNEEWVRDLLCQNVSSIPIRDAIGIHLNAFMRESIEK